MHNDKRRLIKHALLLGAFSLLPFSLVSQVQAAETVKVGIIHSLTGTMAISEASVVDAEKLAIDEINASGGVLGKTIEPIVEDGASDWPTFAEKARKLLENDHVVATFGAFTSASRKAVLPVFERNKALLYYPTFYEGLEKSPAIIYTGAEASQQTLAAVSWLMANKGKTVYLVGSDYIWPRTTNKLARASVTKQGGSIVGEDYLPLGNIEFSSVINKIKAAKPDIVLSTIVGGSNVAFYKQLKAAGIDSSNQTLMALAVTEEEVTGIGAENLTGFLTCMSYFQSLKNPVNEKFVAAFKARYGDKRVVGDPMAAAYTAVYLWKKAVEKAGSFDVPAVIAASSELTLDAPEGEVKVHKDNHHLWKRARIGTLNAQGQVDVIYESAPIEPNPFPKL
ncbi:MULTISPECIES: urea ABC transporter substrate-binding protein [Pseudomonas]|jgi:urea transport system substrate-binding protein|uniref:Urea ABC transporter substrate-binding protein n=3 Tax=Bacteria TaxID=2 RepID=A0A1B3CVW7_PSEFL|nr:MULTISPECIES: urea ABC transporter substrate-binding protein [Pseudomonas]HAA41144.1 urea ABC transporter substrate-binding protein [Pseudomonas sp.]AOE69180.1 urea ABC transporter substrate-binding protein [Pseudomonas fluorescens]AOE74965.1 urea ABC transporter substrate-binding protein [Pseudomonas fluorescens]KAA8551458.1 Aliphatic amidase expression-regulating protein [Pseudomonas marginalis]NMZ95090.1 urea ABC transporter substrate-binding protein [Pseudomonas marginalis]